MNLNFFKWLGVMSALVMVALLSFGCGGGGGGATGNRVNVFVTDNLRTGYSAVYARIFQIELIGPDRTVTVFSDSGGRDVNLLRLNDGTQNLYLLMGAANVPAGVTFNQVRVVMGNTMNALRTGQTNYDVLTVQGVSAGTNRVSRTINLSPPRSFSSGENFCLDFDLAAFVLAGSNVTPVIVDITPGGISSDDRHVEDEYKGTVSGLTGTSPNFSFTINTLNGALAVQTTNATAIFNSNGTPNPQLANGSVVEVEGIFDVTANVLRAWKVKIKVGGDIDDPHEAEGRVMNTNEAGNWFVLNAFETEGFFPPTRDFRVNVTDTTIYRADNGAPLTKAEFFAMFAGKTASHVEVEGTFNGTEFTARKVKVDDEDDNDDPNEVEAKGLVTSLNLDTNLIVITLQEAEGFVPPGSSLTVSIATTSEYKDLSNEGVTKTEWINALQALPANQRRVEFEGTFAEGVFNAREAKLIGLDD